MFLEGKRPLTKVELEKRLDGLSGEEREKQMRILADTLVSFTPRTYESEFERFIKRSDQKKGEQEND